MRWNIEIKKWHAEKTLSLEIGEIVWLQMYVTIDYVFKKHKTKTFVQKKSTEGTVSTPFHLIVAM